MVIRPLILYHISPKCHYITHNLSIRMCFVPKWILDIKNIYTEQGRVLLVLSPHTPGLCLCEYSLLNHVNCKVKCKLSWWSPLLHSYVCITQRARLCFFKVCTVHGAVVGTFLVCTVSTCVQLSLWRKDTWEMGPLSFPSEVFSILEKISIHHAFLIISRYALGCTCRLSTCYKTSKLQIDAYAQYAHGALPLSLIYAQSRFTLGPIKFLDSEGYSAWFFLTVSVLCLSVTTFSDRTAK